jgi:hypothetical protein
MCAPHSWTFIEAMLEPADVLAADACHFCCGKIAAGAVVFTVSDPDGDARMWCVCIPCRERLVFDTSLKAQFMRELLPRRH